MPLVESAIWHTGPSSHSHLLAPHRYSDDVNGSHTARIRSGQLWEPTSLSPSLQHHTHDISRSNDIQPRQTRSPSILCDSPCRGGAVSQSRSSKSLNHVENTLHRSSRPPHGYTRLYTVTLLLIFMIGCASASIPSTPQPSSSPSPTSSPPTALSSSPSSSTLPPPPSPPPSPTSSSSLSSPSASSSVDVFYKLTEACSSLVSTAKYKVSYTLSSI